MGNSDQDISDHRETLQRLRRSEEALRQAQRVAHVGSWAWHIPTNRLEWSDEMYRLFGLDQATFTGELSDVIARAIHPDDRAAVEQANQAVIRDQVSPPLEYRVIWPDQTIHALRAEPGELTLDEAGRPAVLTGIVQDVTEPKRLHEERDLTLRLLDRINADTDLRTLMRAVTALLRDATGCQAIGIRLRDGEDFPYYETTGFPPEFVRAESSLCTLDAQGRLVRDPLGSPVLECMCGNILRGRFDPAQPFFTARGSFWTNSTTQLLAATTAADRLSRTRNRCHGEGFESVALIPLRAGGQTFGLLQFNDRRPDRFSPQKIAHYERVADHLGVALARWQAEEALRASEHLARATLDGLSAHVAIVDQYGHIVAVNKAWEDFAEANGPTRRHLGPGTDYLGACDRATGPDTEPARAFAQAVRDVLAGRRDRYEAVYPCHSPTVPRWFVARVTRFPGQGPARVVIAHEAITERVLAEQALRDSEERLRLATAGSNIGLWDWDLRTNDVHYSSIWKRQIGHEDHEISPRFEEWQSRVHPEDVDRSLARLQAFLAAPHSEYENEFRFRHKDGSYRWILAKGSVLLDEAGRPWRVLGSHLDITDRKRAEEALRHSEERFRRLFQFSPSGIVLVSPDSRFLQANDAFCRMLGYTEAQLLGKTFQDVTYPPDRAAGEERVRRVLSGETETFQFEKRYLHQNGSVVWGLISASLIRDAQNRPLHFVTQVHDITERKRAEEQIELLKHSIDIHFDGAYWFDSDNRFVYVNDGACRALGYPREELLGRHLSVVAPRATEQHLQGVWETLRTKGYYTAESVHRRKDGSEFPVDIMATYVRFGGKEYNCGFARNITERKRAEEALRASEAQYRDAAARADRLLEEVNHRVRNNLAGILGLLSLTAADSPSPAALAAALESRIRAVAHTHNLLASHHWRDLDLEQLAREVLGQLAAAASLGPLSDRLRISGPPVTLSPRHASSLALILQELFTNSGKHGSLTAPRGVVELTWRTEGPALTITWRETDGPAIQPPRAKHVGLRLIEGLARHDLGGSVTFDFPPAGLTCTLTLSLPTPETAGVHPRL